MNTKGKDRLRKAKIIRIHRYIIIQVRVVCRRMANFYNMGGVAYCVR